MKEFKFVQKNDTIRLVIIIVIVINILKYFISSILFSFFYMITCIIFLVFAIRFYKEKKNDVQRLEINTENYTFHFFNRFKSNIVLEKEKIELKISDIEIVFIDKDTRNEVLICKKEKLENSSDWDAMIGSLGNVSKKS